MATYASGILDLNAMTAVNAMTATAVSSSMQKSYMGQFSSTGEIQTGPAMKQTDVEKAIAEIVRLHNV